MAEVSDITFSGFKLRLTHENGTFVTATLANSYPPDPNAPVTQLGSPFTLDGAPADGGKPVDHLAAKVGEAFEAGEVRNAKMLGIRLADKFAREHPEVVGG